MPNTSHWPWTRSEEHTSELQSRGHLVCRLLLEKKQIDPLQSDQMKTENATSTDGVSWTWHGTALSGTPFFFNDPATPEIYTLSLHDALPISTSHWPWT